MIRVNFVPITRQASCKPIIEEILSGLGKLCTMSHWQGRPVSLRLMYQQGDSMAIDERLSDGEVLGSICVEGGRFKLRRRHIQIISQPLPLEQSFDIGLLKQSQWGNHFDLCVMVVSAQDLLDSQEVRHQVVLHRTAMWHLERTDHLYLYLSDLQQIMCIPRGLSYADTYMSVLLTLGFRQVSQEKGKGKQCYVSKPARLKPEYTDLWHEQAGVYIGQDIYLRYSRQGRRVALLPGLIAGFKTASHCGGVLELMYLLLELVVQDLPKREGAQVKVKSFSNNYYYNTINNMAFNISSWIDKYNPFGTKTIRLATVGIEASGKTFLLTDILGSLQRMGYLMTNYPGQRYLPLSQFSTHATKIDGEVLRTQALGLRPRYLSKFTLKNESFNLEILDIPGETFQPELMQLFQMVINALFNDDNRESRIFEELHYTRDKAERIIIRYASKEKNGISSDTNQSSMSPQKKFGGDDVDANTTPSGCNPMSVSQAEEELKRLGFTLGRNQTRSVTCSDAYAKYPEYYGNTFFSAILDAWDSLFLDDVHAQNQRDSFAQKMRDAFYNLYYCTNATDIVVCDKAAIPKFLQFSDKENSKIQLLKDNLYNFKTIQGIGNNKNWYLAFKGVDCVLNAPAIGKNAFKPLFTKYCSGNRNALYAYTMLLLAIKTQKNLISEEWDPFNVIDAEPEHKNITDYFEGDIETFASVVDGSLLDPDVLYKSLKECESDDEILSYFFVKDDVYSTPSSADFYHYITERIEAMTESHILDQGEDPNGIFNWLKLPRHVYMCGTMIASDMKIYLQSKDSPNTIPEQVRNITSRFHFGSLQLTEDILIQHNIALPDSYASYGALLSYFFGDN